MSDSAEFVRNEIEALDKEIERANKILLKIESAAEHVRDEKLYKILKAKISDWENKRNILLDIMIKPLQKTSSRVNE